MGNVALPPEAKERLASSKKDGGLEVNLSGLHIKRFSSSISSLKRCVCLDLSLNELVELPASISKLHDLETLLINSNELTSLPADVLRLRDLKVMNAADNRLTMLPAPVYVWRSLESLNISNNRIERLPADFNRLTALKSLLYAGNALRTVPMEIFPLAQLTHLDLADNQLTEVPPSLQALTNLQTLTLAHNQLEGIPDFIAVFASLTSLNLSANLAPTLPDSLSQLTLLKDLNLSVMGLTDLANIRFDGFKQLVSLDCHRNQLAHFPPSLGGLASLKHLNLSENVLLDLPCQLGWLHPTLRSLNLEDNKLQYLPGEVCFLSVSLDVNVKRNPLKSPFLTLYDRGPAKWSDAMAPYVRAFPQYCRVSGQGIQGGIAGVGTSFVITAHDMKNQPRVNGGEKFAARIYQGAFSMDCIVKDNCNGTHSVFYNCTRSGRLSLDVLMDLDHIQGSPFTIHVSPAEALSSFSVSRPFPHGGKPGQLIEWDVLPIDRFGNEADRSCGAILSVDISGGSSPQPLLADLQNGKYHVSFTPGWAATYTVTIKLGGKNIRGSPYQLVIADDYLPPSAADLAALADSATTGPDGAVASSSSAPYTFAGVDTSKSLYGEDKPFGDSYFQKPPDPNAPQFVTPAYPFSSSSSSSSSPSPYPTPMMANPALAGLPNPMMANPALAGHAGHAGAPLAFSGGGGAALAGLPPLGAGMMQGVPLGGMPFGAMPPMGFGGSPALAGLPQLPAGPSLSGLSNSSGVSLDGISLSGIVPLGGPSGLEIRPSPMAALPAAAPVALSMAGLGSLPAVNFSAPPPQQPSPQIGGGATLNELDNLLNML